MYTKNLYGTNIENCRVRLYERASLRNYSFSVD